MKQFHTPQLNALLVATWAIAGFTSTQRGADLRVPSQYPSIQSAVDAANSNDVIRIAPGVYTEQILIYSKKVTLQGSQGTIIRSSQFLKAWSPDVELNFVLPPTAPLLGAVLSDVTLRDLTFEGENLGDYYGTPDFEGYAGVQAFRCNMDAENCSFFGFRENVEGDQYSAALRVGSMHPDSNTARIVGCTFANNSESIFLRGSGEALNLVITIENNTIIGMGPSTNAVINSGIAILQGAGGRVANNRISGYSYAGPERQFPSNFGILADNEANFPEYGVLEHLEFVGNTFKDNQIHLAMVKGDGCVISNNVFQQIVKGPFAAGVVASGNKPVIADNRFEDLEEGVRLMGVDSTFGTILGKASEVQFTNNRFCNVAKPIIIQPTASAVQSGTRVCPFPAPSLEIKPAVLISWSAEETGWTLQSAASADGPWSDTSGSPYLQNGRNNVSIPTLAEKLFFRLR